MRGSHRAPFVQNVMADCRRFHAYEMILSTDDNVTITRLTPVGTVLRHVEYNMLTHNEPTWD